MEITPTVEEYRKAMRLIDAFKLAQEIPHPLEEINYAKLKASTQKYIELLQKGKIGDDDFKEEIFVTAMETVFGEIGLGLGLKNILKPVVLVEKFNRN